jgi:very-short-patch-repair endonuclease
MTPYVRGSWPEIEQSARGMRREPTLAEEALWAALRGRRLGGLKFRRQHPVGRFILDFYCPDCKLVVELDGGVHDEKEQTDKDEARSVELAQFGYRVIRFGNAEVIDDLPSVLSAILTAARSPA